MSFTIDKNHVSSTQNQFSCSIWEGRDLIIISVFGAEERKTEMLNLKTTNCVTTSAESTSESF
jgi:hypothetical protein